MLNFDATTADARPAAGPEGDAAADRPVLAGVSESRPNPSIDR